MYKSSLDGIRAFCVIFTMLNHVHGFPWWVNGSVGVDIFFALSGFLITYLLINELDRTNTINLKSFYIRRAFRILPLYIITIAAYFVLSRVGGSKTSGEFNDSFVWLITMNREYMPIKTEGVFGHAWTLGIEEKFYILWPLAIFAIAFTGRAAVWLLALALTVALLCLPATFLSQGVRGYAGLSFGAFLAYMSIKHPRVENALKTLKLAPFALAAAIASYILLILTKLWIFNIVISMCGAVMVANLWYNEGQLIGRLLSLPVISYLGRLTYALYLTHVIAINIILILAKKFNMEDNLIIVLLASYALSVVGAMILHSVVEKPMIDIGRKLAMSTKPPMAAMFGRLSKKEAE